MPRNFARRLLAKPQKPSMPLMCTSPAPIRRARARPANAGDSPYPPGRRSRAPAVRIERAAWRHMSADNGLQRGFLAVRHDSGMHLTLALVDAEHGRFAERPAPALALHAARAEVGFVHFNLAAHRRRLLAKPRHAHAQRGQVAVDGNATQTSQIGDLHGVQIQRKQAQNAPKFRVRDSRMENVAICH